MGETNISAWSKELDDWEADHDKPNPFESTYAGKFVDDLVLMKTDQDHQEFLLKPFVEGSRMRKRRA